jgi:hypothetical protein
MALSNSCTVQDCPFSHDAGVIAAHLLDKAKLWQGKGKSDARSSQPKAILSRPAQQQQKDQKPRSRFGLVDGYEDSPADESSSSLVTSARATRSKKSSARGSDDEDA